MTTKKAAWNHLHVYIGKNELAECTAMESCHEQRFRVSPYCKRHDRIHHAYGHPMGRLMRPAETAPELAEVLAFLDHFKGHPATVAAEKVVRAWLEGACIVNPKTTPGAGAVRNLFDHGAQPMKIIEIVLSLYLHSRRAWHSLPPDRRLTYAIGRAVMRLAPQPRLISKVSGKVYNASYRSAVTLRTLGEALRSRLEPYITNVLQSITAKETFTAKQEDQMKQPFNAAAIINSNKEHNPQ